MGLRLRVFRSSLRDCTNNGVSSKVNELTLIDADGPFEPTPDAPAVILFFRQGTVVIKPADTGGNCTMFGGNYASTSDSRFLEAVNAMLGHSFYGAVAIHDRVEK